ncbi:uncharacterized protein C8orf74 homolog isoform X2 [Ascaphus truei]|uniref:uncharacterized protein C8orf74 homolog isoform X2 n=1 Tax=Ascaphus truei TaxID=8439 RepID=UPI003F59ED5B
MASLPAEGLREVYRLQKEEGRQSLRKLLAWNEFDESVHLRQSIFLDVIYNSIIFAADKGFPWSVVAKVARLSEQLLHDIKGVTILEIMHMIEDKIHEFEIDLPSNHVLILLDYFIDTFIRHYQLYQFVLCQEQELIQTVVKLDIHLPPNPPPLSEGVNIDLWRYQQQLAHFASDETQKRTNMFLLREILHLEREEKLRSLYKGLELQETQMLDKQVLEKIVKEAIGVQMEFTGEILLEELKTSFEILELRQQKQSLNAPAPHPPPVPDPATSKVQTTKKPPQGRSTKKKMK